MEYLLATNNSELIHTFRSVTFMKTPKLSGIDVADKLSKVFRRKGKILEVIILDLSMPDKDLNRFIFYIKKFNQDIPVVLLSVDRSLTKESEAMRNLSVYGCIKKPSNKQETIEILEDLNKIFELDMDKKIEKVEYFEAEKVFVCTFRNKQDLFLPRKDIPEDDSSTILGIVVDRDKYFFSVTLRSGKKYSVPWDFIRYICDEKYEFAGRKAGKMSAPDLGKRVAWLRKSKKLTQEALARKSGIQRANIARIESGRHFPSLETLERIADSFKIPVARIVGN